MLTYHWNIFPAPFLHSTYTGFTRRLGGTTIAALSLNSFVFPSKAPVNSVTVRYVPFRLKWTTHLLQRFLLGPPSISEFGFLALPERYPVANRHWRQGTPASLKVNVKRPLTVEWPSIYGYIMAAARAGNEVIEARIRINFCFLWVLNGANSNPQRILGDVRLRKQKVV